MLAAGSLIGCSSTVTGQAVADSSTASASSKADQVKAACPLLSAADFGAALGVSNLTANEDKPAAISKGSIFQCDYKDTGGHTAARLYLEVYPPGESTVGDFMTESGVDGPATPLSGLGDAAEYVSGKNDQGTSIDTVLAARTESGEVVGLGLACRDQPGAKDALTGLASKVLDQV
jgi:hypothetical protein